MKPRAVLGYSLMEVLIAMLVLSAGVMGAAGLQLSAWQLTQQSSYHSAAHQLAVELAEWLHVFDDATLDGLPSGKITAEHADPASATHCYGRHCTIDDLVRFIVAEWQTGLRSQLPEAEWRLCRDASSWDAKTEVYSWHCDGNISAPLVIKIAWRNRHAPEKQFSPQIVLSTGR